MTGQRKERLKAAGMDVDESLGRVLGNEALLERLLAKFADSPQLHQLEVAFGRGDGQEAIAAAHTLKGVCGNLSMKGLSMLFSRQVELLRAGEFSQAAGLMEQIAPAYQAMVLAIREQTDEKT